MTTKTESMDSVERQIKAAQEFAAVDSVARAIAPMICAPVHNGDCDDVAAGQDFARRVARAAIAACEATLRAEIVEECARIAETFYSNSLQNMLPPLNEKIAAAIRKHPVS